jgi:Ser/Thr protein kinase RdoA (MazF antagonist)
VNEGRCDFVRQAGNTLFRIRTSELPGLTTTEDLFEKDQYLLKIHEPGYQEPEALELELIWLDAMRREVNLPVQEPIAALNGKLLLPVHMEGVEGTRHCSLLRWIKGHSIKKRFCPHHFRAQGKLMARMHEFSRQWQPPADLTKRRYDWKGLFQEDASSGMTNADAFGLLAPVERKAFSFVAERLREVMNDWGQDRDVFGLIHGDLGVDANLLFWHGEPRVIDFDDSGVGYWIFDLAVALDACRDTLDFDRYKEALLNGYTEIRSLPEKQVEQIDLFFAGFQVYWNLWAAGGTHLYPQLRAEYGERIAATTEFVVRYARQNGCHI